MLSILSIESINITPFTLFMSLQFYHVNAKFSMIYCNQLYHVVNECQSNPCRNLGRCIDNLNGYKCECPRGYSTGTNCETS